MRVVVRKAAFDLGGANRRLTCYLQGVQVGKAWGNAKVSLAELRRRTEEGMGPRENRELLAELEDELTDLRKKLEGVSAECAQNEHDRLTGIRETHETMGFAVQGEFINADDALNDVI